VAGISLVVALLVVLPAPAIAQEGTVVVDGGGWGHSVGMPQYGAYGQALEGKDYKSILAHYYQGTGVETIADPGPITVGLLQELTSALFVVGSGSVTVQRGTEQASVSSGQGGISVNVSGGQCTVSGPGISWGAGSCEVQITGLNGPTTTVWFGAFQYGRGTLKTVVPVTSSLLAVNVEVPTVEQYVYGVKEIPYGWPLQALKAQAVAARSYALYKRKFVRPECGCHVHDDTRDQVYVGWGLGEDPWLQAVDETAWEVVTYPGVKPVPTFYHSSTFGHTEDAAVGFGGTTSPYLVGVPDPWSLKPEVKNPYARWKAELTAADAAARLGMSSVTGASITQWSTSGAAKEVEFSGSPASTRFPTYRLRSLLGLRSGQILGIQVAVSLPPGADTVAFVDGGAQWHLYGALQQGASISRFYYGIPGDVPLMGDWNCDGVDTPAMYRRSSGFIYLRNSNTQGVADISYFFGNPSDIPIAGDFNGDNCDTLAIYRPSEGKVYVKDSLGTGVADYSHYFGNPGDQPFTGDFNGDGTDTVGLYRQSAGSVYFRNSNTQGVADFDYFYGNPGDKMLTGDWDLNGTDTLAVYRPSDGKLYVRFSNTQGVADLTLTVGSYTAAVGAGR
jgi:SpoIID/LytB domain protein